mgnify:CR=1 FL=1
MMGSSRFMFAFATSLAIQSFTLLAVSALGDTAEAWRTVAIAYAIIGLIVNTTLSALRPDTLTMLTAHPLSKESIPIFP